MKLSKRSLEILNEAKRNNGVAIVDGFANCMSAMVLEKKKLGKFVKAEKIDISKPSDSIPKYHYSGDFILAEVKT